MKRALPIVVICALIIGIIVGAVVLPKMGKSEKSSVTTVTKSSLENVLKISQLSTVDYTYNAIVKVCQDDNPEKVMYYVAYDGVVTAGINFEKIGFQINDTEKSVVILLPPVEVQEVSVDMGTMEFIFKDDKYNTETVSQEAYKACLADLRAKAASEDALFTVAQENAKMSIRALFLPWFDAVYSEYTVEIRQRRQ